MFVVVCCCFVVCLLLLFVSVVVLRVVFCVLCFFSFVFVSVFVLFLSVVCVLLLPNTTSSTSLYAQVVDSPAGPSELEETTRPELYRSVGNLAAAAIEVKLEKPIALHRPCVGQMF
jgi:hypothetical protein